MKVLKTLPILLTLLFVLAVGASQTKWICGRDICYKNETFSDQNKIEDLNQWTCDTGGNSNSSWNGQTLTYNDNDATYVRGCSYQLDNGVNHLTKRLRFCIDTKAISGNSRIEIRDDGTGTWVTTNCRANANTWTQCCIERVMESDGDKVKLLVGGTDTGTDQTQWRNGTIEFYEVPKVDTTCPNASFKMNTPLGIPTWDNYSTMDLHLPAIDQHLTGFLQQAIAELEFTITQDMTLAFVPHQNVYVYTEDNSIAPYAELCNHWGCRYTYIINSDIGDRCIPVRMPGDGSKGKSLPEGKALIGWGTNGTNCVYGGHDSAGMWINDYDPNGQFTAKLCYGDVFLLEVNDTLKTMNFTSVQHDAYAIYINRTHTITKQMTGTNGQIDFNT